MQLENISDFVSVACNLNMYMSPELSEAESVNHDLEICDDEVGAMKAECDKHMMSWNIVRKKITL